MGNPSEVTGARLCSDTSADYSLDIIKYHEEVEDSITVNAVKVCSDFRAKYNIDSSYQFIRGKLKRLIPLTQVATSGSGDQI